MSMQHIRDTYGVPVKRGARVEVSAGEYTTRGTITSAGRSAREPMTSLTSTNRSYIRVRLDGCNFSLRFHPTLNIRYLDAAQVQQHKGE